MMKDFMNIINNCDLAFYNYRFNFYLRTDLIIKLLKTYKILTTASIDILV